MRRRTEWLGAGRVGEGVVEGREGVGARDVELEELAELPVGDRDLHAAAGGVPQERDVHAVALAVREIDPEVAVCSHGFFSFRAYAGHGIATSATGVAVVR